MLRTPRVTTVRSKHSISVHDMDHGNQFTLQNGNGDISEDEGGVNEHEDIAMQFRLPLTR
jgi:hypothetical protein